MAQSVAQLQDGIAERALGVRSSPAPGPQHEALIFPLGCRRDLPSPAALERHPMPPPAWFELQNVGLQRPQSRLEPIGRVCQGLR